MDDILAVIGLLTRAFEAMKAYFELRKSKYGGNDHISTHKRRPKHLRG